MGFPSQRTAIPFTDASGQNEASNAEVDPGPVMALVNGEYDHDDDIVKRRGFQSLGSVPGGMLAHQLVSTGTYGGLLCHNALLGITGGALDAPTRKRLQHGMQAHVSSAYVHTNASSARYGSVAFGDSTPPTATQHWMCVVTDFAGGSEAVVVDATTGSVLKRTSMAFADFTQVVYLSGKFYCYYRNSFSSHVDVTVIDPTADTEAITTNLFTPNATTQQFCAVADPSGGVLFSYQSNGGGNVLTVARSTDGTTIATTFADAATNCESFAIIRNTVHGNVVQVAYGRTNAAGGGAFLVTFNSGLSARTLGPTQVLTNLAGDRFQPGLVQPANGVKLYVIGNDLSETSGGEAHYNTCRFDHTEVGTTTRLRGYYWLSAPVGLVDSENNAFNAGTALERCYGLLGQNEDLQHDGVSATPTAWLVMLGPNITDVTLNFNDATCPKFSDGQAGGVVPVAMVVTDGGNPTPIFTGWTGTTVPVTDTPMRGPLVVPAKLTNTLYFPTAMLTAVDESYKLANRVVRVTPAFSNELPSPRVTINGTAYVGGGLLRHYDGSGFIEQTPLHPPLAFGTVTVGGGGVPVAGTYAYCGVFVWEDEDGDVHRSSPSPAFTVVSGGGSLTTFWKGTLASLGIPEARYLQPLSLEVYRTKAGAATFHLQSTHLFSAGTDITNVDTTTDAVLGTRRILYTDGGVLAAEPAPASTAMAAHQDRLWLLDAVDPTLLHPSKVKEQGVDYEFNAALTLRIESQEAPVALASMDDKLLVFTSRDCYAVVGQGPDATGVGGTFIPELCVRGVGATGRHAALSTPIGTIVHTQGGFRLLGRDLSVQDIGKLLTDSAPGTVSVRASVYFPARQQAWFLLSNQYIAVFDHRRDGLRCSLFALASGLNSDAFDLVDIGGAPHLLSYNSGDGKHYVYRQHETKSDDAGQFVPLAVQTGWFRIGGDTGLQDGRFRVLHVYGAFPEASGSAGYSGLTVGVEVQGEQRSLGTSESATFSKSNLNITNPSHVRMRLKRQRGYAARVTLAQVQDSGSGVDSRGYSPFGIEWEWAAVAPVAGRVGAAGGAGA